MEISSIDDPSAQGAAGTARELHILGYLIDHTDAAFAATLADFLADRERRTLRMAEALREQGLELDDAAISAARRAPGSRSGAPISPKRLLAAPANAARLREEQIDDIGSLIRGYLIEGRPAFRLRETPTVAQAIEAIHAAGGVASGRTPSGTSPTPTRCWR